jgi:hypothetical protein
LCLASQPSVGQPIDPPALVSLLSTPQVCLLALGHCSPEHYPVLFEELPALMDEYQRPKQRRGAAARPEEVCVPGGKAQQC